MKKKNLVMYLKSNTVKNVSKKIQREETRYFQKEFNYSLTTLLALRSNQRNVNEIKISYNPRPEIEVPIFRNFDSKFA